MRLVATISNPDEITLAGRADLIEIRLDLYDFTAENIRKLVGKKGVIATFRRVAEGGKYRGSDSERIRRLKEFAEGCRAEFVDLENDLPDQAFDFNCQIIESYHNFTETPEYSELKGIVESARGDIVKIATMGRSKRDVLKIVRLLTEYDNVVSFLMGKNYSFTRLFSAFLGSPLVYCYVGEPKAPGQIHLDDAYRIVNVLR